MNKKESKYAYPKWVKESYSSEGEDRIALSLLRKQINNFDNKFFYIDIGSNDPIRFSNTYLFYKLGLRGICIDPLPSSKKKFKLIREEDIFENVAISENSKEIFLNIYENDDTSTTDLKTQNRYNSKMNLIERRKVNTLTLKQILKKNKLPERIQIPLLSIDAEGVDFTVFEQAMLIKNRFDLIIIEDKMVNLSKSYPYSDICSLAKDNNYLLLAKTPLNSIFIDNLSSTFDWLPDEMIKDKN